MSAAKSLYQALSAYGESDYYPCHMPGHKRSPLSGEMADFYQIDITEIDGFDNLHQPEGILLEAQKRANRLYGTDETFFLVNGSTCGVLAAVMAAVRPGDEILMARNCHKSVYHAAVLQGLQAHYYHPGLIREYDICDGVCPEDIGRLLDTYPGCRAVVVTSPTYEGIISDVAGIADVVHKRGKILIVDEAHGAHLGLAGDMPCSAAVQGADLVIHSLHKTLPSMTQTALLHVNGGRIDRIRLRRYLSMLQSSSPSYVLMASMDSCVRFLEEQGQERFAAMKRHYEDFCKKTEGLKRIRIGKMTDVSGKGYALTDWDIGKIVISVRETAMTGKELNDILRKEYRLELEMASKTYALAMMTLMDEAEGWQRLADALRQIDGRIEESVCGGADDRVQSAVKAPVFRGAGLTMAQAFHSPREEVLLEHASGRISADFITPYPPGVPLAAPGELIDEELLKQIKRYLETGITLQGISPEGEIGVVVEILTI